jgi:hypothetical protein
MLQFFSKRLAQQIRQSRFLLLLGIALVACANNVPALATQTPAPTAQVITSPMPTAARTAAPAPSRELPTLLSPTQTVEPTRQPTLAVSAPTRARSADVMITTNEITLDVYPYESYLRDARDANTKVAFRALDRAAYDASVSGVSKQQKTFRTVILENEYLKLTFLPELGGRLYQITYKPTNQNLLYNNRVLKPSPWGMPEQQGWLAAGGIEWAFPTQEHGYEWNAPWQYETQMYDSGARIILRDSIANDRPRAQVRVTLPAHPAYFEITPRIENPTNAPMRLQFWDNAMLTLGASKQLSPRTEFNFPDDSVFVHSTANEWIPPEFVPEEGANAPRAPVSFSNLNGHDLRVFQNWDSYLGVFAQDSARANLATNFVGAYNQDAALGVARMFPPAQAPGVKLFAWGTHPCCTADYTDDGSEYFEMWGGMPRTFFPNDDVTLAPGETRSWTETWLPLAHMNGLSAASKDAALSMRADGTEITITAYSAIARQAKLVLEQNDVVIQQWDISFVPAQAVTYKIAAEKNALKLKLRDANNNSIVETP